MQESDENTHAAPKLVNRPSPHTLSRPCDLGHGHGKTSQSGPTTRHNCPDNSAEAATEPRKHESAPENVMATQTRVLSRMPVNTSTLQRTWHDGRYLLFSTMLQPTLTRTTDGNTSWALPKMLTKKHMSVGAKHFVKTHGVPTPANTICRRRVR